MYNIEGAKPAKLELTVQVMILFSTAFVPIIVMNVNRQMHFLLSHQ